jgi:hypothetical protein
MYIVFACQQQPGMTAEISGSLITISFPDRAQKQHPVYPDKFGSAARLPIARSVEMMS